VVFTLSEKVFENSKITNKTKLHTSISYYRNAMIVLTISAVT